MQNRKAKKLQRKIRVVIDTNLIISGIFGKDTLSGRLQELWISRDIVLVSSIEIMREISRVIQYPRIKKHFNPKQETVRRFFRLVFRKAVITKDIYKIDKVKSDPSDNKFLACAIEGNADYIVSRDKHLRDLKKIKKIKIIGVTEFLEIFERLKE